jgi:hypothetical protein
MSLANFTSFASRQANVHGDPYDPLYVTDGRRVITLYPESLCPTRQTAAPDKFPEGRLLPSLLHFLRRRTPCRSPCKCHSLSNMTLLMLAACHSLCFQNVTPLASNMTFLMLLTSHSLCFQHVTPYASNKSLLMLPTCHFLCD